MTLPQVYELMAYWESWPPLHRLFAPVASPGRRRRAVSPAEGAGGIGALLALAPGGLCRRENLSQGGGG